MSYRIGFVTIALEELGDNTSDFLKYTALGVRLSKLENDEFSKFIKEGDNTTPQKVEVDHEAQMKQFKKG